MTRRRHCTLPLQHALVVNGNHTNQRTSMHASMCWQCLVITGSTRQLNSVTKWSRDGSLQCFTISCNRSETNVPFSSSAGSSSLVAETFPQSLKTQWPAVQLFTCTLCLILTAKAWKQTSGDPSGLTLHYRGVTLLYNFTTALLYMVLSVTMARIVVRLLNIYQTVKIKNKINT